MMCGVSVRAYACIISPYLREESIKKMAVRFCVWVREKRLYRYTWRVCACAPVRPCQRGNPSWSTQRYVQVCARARAFVCVSVYLLNTDKSSLPLLAAIPPIAITTAAPRHARIAAHYRTVLVCLHPLLSSRKKRVLQQVKNFLPPSSAVVPFENRFFMNTITRQTKSNPSYPNHHRRVMPVTVYL